MIDTIKIKYASIADSKRELETMEKYIIKDILDDDTHNIVIRPNTNGTSSIYDTLTLKGRLDDIMTSIGVIQRVDIAYDTTNRLADNKQLYSTFLQCLSIVRHKEVIVYSTSKNLQVKNYKISKNNYATTIYDCSDKTSRLANTRVEHRSLYIRDDLADNEKIKKQIEKYNNELRAIVERLEGDYNILDIIDKMTVGEYIDGYNNNTDARYTNKTEYIAYLERLGCIRTRDTLALILEGIGYKSRVSKFIQRFRSTRGAQTLRFVTKSELKQLIKSIIADNKITINDSKGE